MSLSAIAGVDVGAGGIRVSVEADGTVAKRGRVAAMPLVRGAIDEPRLTMMIAKELQDTASTLAATSFSRIAIGVAGLPGRMADPMRFAQMLCQALVVDTIIVAGDAVTTHVGALDGREGAVIAAGTGVVALGTDLDTVWNRADGWGLLLGDEGGGAWIGMAGLKAALRAYDGRADGSRTLLDSMRTAFGEPHLLVEQVYAHDTPASRLASFTPAVAAAARAGDPIAVGIWRDAATHLAATLAAAASGVEPLLSWGGRLFDAGEILLEPFKEAVHSRVPDARIIGPSGSSEDGALLLARSPGDLPVRSHQPYVYVFDRGQRVTR